jgi:hypothetical protein
MAKAELTKTIEAFKLNKRTMRPMNNDSHTIPFGAIIDHVKEDGEHTQFHYLGEPYQGKADTLSHAIKKLD